MAGKQTREHARPRPRTGAHESRPADTDHDGDPKPAQPSSDEQSGSTGRRAADETQPAGADTGQDRYGQSGLAGKDPGKPPSKPGKA